MHVLAGVEVPMVADGMTLRRTLVMLWVVLIVVIIGVRRYRRRRFRAENRRVRSDYERDPKAAAERYGHADFDAWEDARETPSVRALTSAKPPKIRRER